MTHSIFFPISTSLQARSALVAREAAASAAGAATSADVEAAQAAAAAAEARAAESAAEARAARQEAAAAQARAAAAEAGGGGSGGRDWQGELRAANALLLERQAAWEAAAGEKAARILALERQLASVRAICSQGACASVGVLWLRGRGGGGIGKAVCRSQALDL